MAEPAQWEAVTAEDGRTYYWNVETNETSCASLSAQNPPTDSTSTSLSVLPLLAGEMPSVTKATAGVAAGYVGSAQAASTPSASSSAASELEELRAARSGGKVADLTKRLTESLLGQAGLTHSNPWARRCSAPA